LGERVPTARADLIDALAVDTRALAIYSRRGVRPRTEAKCHEGQDVTIYVESETDEQRVERCDHEGTTGPLNGLASISNCTACGKTWPSRFGAGAATVRIVSKRDERGG